MKDTYNRHKRNRKLGTGSSALSKPTKWALSDALSFLDVVLYERECLSSIQPYTNEYASENENNSILEDSEVQELNNTPSIIPSTSQGYVGPIEDIIEDNIENINSVPEKRKSNTEKWPPKKQKQNEEWISVLKQGSEERKKIFEIINKVEEDDPIDTFFKSMASTVKTFSTSLKIKAKKEIFDIVNNLEFQNHGINNDSTPRIYSSSPSTQSSQSTFTTYNHPVPVEGLPEVANNYQISRENWMQYGEDYDQ
ncbi:uncharacterized protein LOC132941213 [Metopolophium dirhodum]|uniref:uncharacterized protein LOC132941213 n=1 Tax=Metopolophium dirhodum TaxID=44670 RepID=UPI00298F9603|nr:uncharacterized protein LOC132941213 [Metopolophium dirhodum]